MPTTATRARRPKKDSVFPPSGVFEKYRSNAYPYRFAGTLLVSTIAGGTPTSTRVAEGWLRSKMADSDDLIRSMVAETMVERGLDAEDAMKAVVENQHLNGFKRDEQGLYIEGRQLKAGFKEAASVRFPKVRWGPSSKGTISYFAEHFFVVEHRLHLGVTEPSGISQRFVHTWRGNGIQYEEYVTGARIDFTMITDVELSDEQWALLWLTAQEQGIGASRSQGFGRYEVVAWAKV